MSNAKFSRHRLCCRRQIYQQKTKSQTNKQEYTNDKENILMKYLSDHQQFNSQTNISSNQTFYSSAIQIDDDLSHLTNEYIQRINDYRFRLGYLPIEISNELTYRAIERAQQLSTQNHTETSNPKDLIHSNQPIGEIVMSCQSPVESGHDIARFFCDELIYDIKNGCSPKKRCAPIFNPDCKYLGFGVIRNKQEAKDFIVIYYYPIQKRSTQ